jgi:hypothetical protein
MDDLRVKYLLKNEKNNKKVLKNKNLDNLCFKTLLVLRRKLLLNEFKCQECTSIKNY